MPYSIELRFDRALAGHVLALRESLAIPPELLGFVGEPHCSLAVYDDESAVDPEALADAVDRLTEERRALPVTLASIGLFPTAEAVLYLAPVASPALLALHHRYHALAAAFVGACRPHYLPGRWVPHCTLATCLPRAALLAAVERLWTDWQPQTGTIDEVALIRAYPVEVRHRCALPGGDLNRRAGPPRACR